MITSLQKCFDIVMLANLTELTELRFSNSNIIATLDGSKLKLELNN